MLQRALHRSAERIEQTDDAALVRSGEGGMMDAQERIRQLEAGYDELRTVSNRLKTALDAANARADAAERDAASLRHWLDNNTAFYNVDADWPVEGPNIPVLAQVSERIWYHATDDIKSYPFSAAIDRAIESI